MKTRKYVLISLTLFACAAVANAQPQTPITAAGTSAPTIPKEYVSADGRFKILFPAAPNEIHETLESSMGKFPFHMLICPTSTASYHVVYVDYPLDLESPDLVNKALDSARQGSLARIAKEDPRIIKESDISVEGHTGRYLEVELKGDAIIRLKYFVVGNRVYMVGLGSPKQKPKIVDATNDYESIAYRFMDSFKIIPALEADTSTSWKEFSSTEGGFKVQFPGTPQQSSMQARASGPMHIASYQSAAAYTAMYFDYSETPKDLIARLELLDNLRLGEIESGLKGLDPNLLSECTTSFEGYPGRLLTLEISNNRIYRRKMLLVGNRIYIMTATAPKDTSTTRNSYETLSLRFLNSFSFIPSPVKE